MNEYLDRTLVADFPILYGQRYGDMRETCMVWGFPGDGWEPLIRDLSTQLEFLNENTPVHVEAIQVKEKFGGLRFYVGGIEGGKFWADIVFALIDAAEARSYYICEDCGARGEERPGGWIRTLCDACYDKRNQPTEA
jgi:hypothetical protein